MQQISPETGSHLEALHLAKTYSATSGKHGAGKPNTYAVADVSLRMEAGKTLALVGESGCGKSTIARMLVGLEDVSSGNIYLDGLDLAQKGARKNAWFSKRRIQMVFQDPYASLNPRWRISKILAEAINGTVKLNRSQLQQAIVNALQQVGLPANAADKYPHEFSGGQRQRISIARALASQPQFLICDEPTSALDVSVQAQILNLLKDIQQDVGLSLLMITHDLSVVHHMADHVSVMYLGRLVEDRNAEALFANPLHPYTRTLLETIPRADQPGRRVSPMSGEAPNPLNPPSGCPFHPRCSSANARCQSEIPTPISVTGGSVACHAIEEGRLK